MSSEVAAAYDAMADRYVAHVGREFEKNSLVRERLEAFAAMVTGTGPVADLGCGPGHVTKLLHDLGVRAIGYDLSEGLLAHARQSFPSLAFALADLTELSFPDHSLSGLVSRHSTIHLDPALLAAAYVGWARVLEAEAPLFLSFFAAATVEEHGTAFDHAVATAYALSPAVIEQHLAQAGFVEIDVVLRPYRPEERPMDQALVIARRGP